MSILQMNGFNLEYSEALHEYWFYYNDKLLYVYNLSDKNITTTDIFNAISNYLFYNKSMEIKEKKEIYSILQKAYKNNYPKNF